MLRAYLDALRTSGPLTVHARPLLVVAGLVGEDEQWARGEQRWSAALARARTEHFNMVDFEARTKPPWSEWTEPRRRALLHRLVTLTASTVLMGAAAIVDMNDHDKLEEDAKQRLGSPYLLAVGACVGVIARWCEQQESGEKVEYVLERDALGTQRFREALTRIIEESDDFMDAMRMRSITMGGRQDVPPLQMAGILAWEVTRHAPRCLGLDGTFPRRSMERLLDAVPLEALYFEASALRIMADRHTPAEYRRAAQLFGVAMRANPGSTGAPSLSPLNDHAG